MIHRKKKLTRRYGRGKHVMGKHEASLMRRLQSETGMSEEDIRSCKKYRKMLSDIQKVHLPEKANIICTDQEAERQRISFKQEFENNVTCWLIHNMNVVEAREMTERLYKRCVGMSDKRLKKFHYTTLKSWDYALVLQVIDQSTDGMFAFNPTTDEVGFMYESNLTMFLLSYQAIK